MTYSFRNRFKIDRGRRLLANSQEYVLAESASDGKVVLRPGAAARNIDDESGLVVQGSGYADYDVAKDTGRRWRQYLTQALARQLIGADFGDDEEDS